MHETGHAMYELGLPSEWQYQPVGKSRGMAMHESQSLLIEMQITRSFAFKKYLSNYLKNSFNFNGKEWSSSNLYLLGTRVRKNYIRVEADEVTYPLHIILRFNLEQRILNEDLLAKNKLLSTKKNSNTESTNSSIIDQVVIFEDSELSDNLYLFFIMPNKLDEYGEPKQISFSGATISPHLSQSELMGEFEEGQHMNKKFIIIYENRENKVWEGGMDWGEWVIEEGPFLIGIEKL